MYLAIFLTMLPTLVTASPIPSLTRDNVVARDKPSMNDDLKVMAMLMYRLGLNVVIAVNPDVCRCCMEIDQCRHKMYEYEEDESNRKCILDHPGFDEVCLNEFVLEAVSSGLKNQKVLTRSFLQTACGFGMRFFGQFKGSHIIVLTCCCYNKTMVAIPEH
ncbi:Hypothetical predicted protein [Paramuricea clavata]|uniref:Uncharacterized protein n=1 Tax=Paramuricea clavata TaxID=317549 RepID=A0A7D9JCN8_PARCT|nr:Hypothetical predicted protein [Paramuricea clavata]